VRIAGIRIGFLDGSVGMDHAHVCIGNGASGILTTQATTTGFGTVLCWLAARHSKITPVHMSYVHIILNPIVTGSN
jgi:hypothetical protein